MPLGTSRAPRLTQKGARGLGGAQRTPVGGGGVPLRSLTLAGAWQDPHNTTALDLGIRDGCCHRLRGGGAGGKGGEGGSKERGGNMREEGKGGA